MKTSQHSFLITLLALVSRITIASSQRFELGTHAGELSVDILDRESINWGQSEAWEEWMGDYKRRIENRSLEMDKGLAVDSYCYTAVIDACAKGNQWKKAMELFDEMEAKGIEPTQVTYSVTISALGNGLQWERALWLLNLMREKGMQVNQIIEVIIPDDKFPDSKRPGGLVLPGEIPNLEPIDPGFDIERCSFIKAAINIGTDFGEKAKCECKGDFAIDLGCSFDECAPGSEVCGTVNLDFDFGEPDGIINITACTSFKDDKFKETCISHRMDVTGDGGITWITAGSDYSGTTETCEATYGGQQCECIIDDNGCMLVDCSPFLYGGKTDTCQFLSMVYGDDTESWFPKFDVFQPSTTSNDNTYIDSAGSGMVGGGAALMAAMATTGLLLGEIW